MYSSGQSASVDSNAAVSLPQREVNKDNEVVAGDIGEPMQTQKQTALTQSGAVTDPYVTNATCSESNSDSSSFTRSTTIVSAVTDQDGFYTGKR